MRRKRRRNRLHRLEHFEARNLLATFVVTTAGDVVDAADGLISLREAINDANTNPGVDTIAFDSSLDGSTIRIQLSGTGENNNAQGDFDITDNVAISGNGMNQTRISGGFLDRIFDVAADVDLAIQDLLLLNGGNVVEGGAIRGSGQASDLSILRTRLQSNEVVGELDFFESGSGTFFVPKTAQGGAIHFSDGTLSIQESFISGNTATGVRGGSASYSGYVNPTQSFASNGGSALGGAISLNSATATITGSRFSMNTAAGGQGGSVQGAPDSQDGIGKQGGLASGGALNAIDSVVTIQRSSVTSNGAFGGLGSQGQNTNGIYIGDVQGDAGDSGDGGDATGGGIAADGSNVEIQNTTIARNFVIGGNGARGGRADYIPPPNNSYGVPSEPSAGNGGDGGDGGNGLGGGLAASHAGAFDLSNVTITENSAGAGRRGAFGAPGVPGTPGSAGIAGQAQGGGLEIENTSVLNATATLIAENNAVSGPDVFGDFASATSVLLMDTADASGITAGAGGNLLNVDPLLEPLRLQGLTFVAPISPVSPAFDAASTGALVDQLGTARPQGAAIDIGAFEALVGATFVVNSTADNSDTNPGDGIAADAFGNVTLRSAIEEANALANTDGKPDLISFQFDGEGPHIIDIRTDLPSLTDSVVISATSQTGYMGAPVVQVDGNQNADFGIRLATNDSIVAGLSITGFNRFGVDIGGNANALIENYVGLNLNGVADGNDLGVRIVNGVGNTVRGNTISGNLSSGMTLVGSASENLIESNLIGTNVMGMSEIPNGRDGIAMFASDNQIVDNTISGNDRWGIYVRPGADRISIFANRIGTDSGGQAAVPNLIGVLVQSSRNQIGNASSSNGNIISGNETFGLAIGRSTGILNSVEDNIVGLNQSGTAAVPNGLSGIQLSLGTGNSIGGLGQNEGNLIGGNLQHGILLVVANENELLGNRIGVNVAGSVAIANNGDGVRIVQGSSDNLVRGNQIAGNVKRGVSVGGVTTVGNDVWFNLIGVNARADAALHNGSGGAIRVDAPGTSVVGNTISSMDHGVLAFRDAADIVIAQNFIGTNQSACTITCSVLGMTNGVLLSSGADNALVDTNTIANNVTGVAITGGVVGARLTQNAIFNNSSIGIDLGGDGQTSNDLLDFDFGENNLQNFPVLSNGQLVGSQLQLTYRVGSSKQASTYPMLIEFYKSDGNGQGMVFLGSDFYTKPQANTDKLISIIVGDQLSVGDSIVAIAIDQIGNTSEFSEELEVIS